MASLPVFNIQKYCIHDGDGIRTTVFFKGCPLRCAWCHNPESQKAEPQLLWDAEKCTQCGACAAVCPQGAAGESVRVNRERCRSCGVCVRACPAGARQLSGKGMSPEEIVETAKKDLMFYEQSGGGVTLSGGEVMAAEPFDEVVRLCRLLHEEGISVFVDTCGMTPYERFDAIRAYTDCFLYDIKAMDPEKHKKWTGADNGLILENLRRLSRDGARLRLRLPLVEGINAEPEDVLPVIELLNEGVRAEKIHLLPYHTFGQEKYRKLGRSGQGERFGVPSPEKLESLAELFRQAGYSQVVMGG